MPNASRWLRSGLVLLLTGSCATQRPASAQPSSDPFIATIESIKLAVAPIVCRATDATGQAVPKLVIGSAFFTSADGEFMTARHVLVDMAKVEGGCNPALYVPRGPWPRTDAVIQARFYSFKQCPAVVEAADIAVCKTDRDPQLDEKDGVRIVPVRFSAELPSDGTPIAFTGFPQGQRLPVTSRGHVAAVMVADAAEGVQMMIDKNGWRGLSGGPVYLGNGRVIGVVIRAGFGDFAGVTIARPIAAIAGSRKQ